MALKLCPCRSGKTYQKCCEPLHQGQAADSPKSLMRSRFTGFALGLADYLVFSLAKNQRTPNLATELESNFEPHMTWVELKIHSATGKQVHFSAYYIAGDRFGELEEISEFCLEEGHWKYQTGQLIPHEDIKLSRNQACPCGSGKKFKQCCAKKLS